MVKKILGLKKLRTGEGEGEWEKEFDAKEDKVFLLPSQL